MAIDIKQMIIDMDGVLWHGETPLPGLTEFFQTLDRLGIRYVLATNNATRTAVRYSEKLARFGITVDADQIVTSSEATASYLRRQHDEGTAVYPVGEQGLHNALESQGFTLVSMEQVFAGETAPLVVVGFTRHVVYKDLAAAAILINNGAKFVGTNPDVSFPSEYGKLPGAGALLAFLQAATGVEPVIIGKPGPIIFEEAVARLGNGIENTAMVGDRLNTDIAGSHAVGLTTILVLSGISREEEIADSDVKPDYVFADINGVSDFLLSQTAESDG